MDKFSERLKHLRKQRHVKQADIALLLGVTVRHYQDIEYGKVNIPALSLCVLADYFQVSLDYLMGRSNDPNKH